MSNYTPKTRLEKILMGVNIAARNGLEKAVKHALSQFEPLEVVGELSKNESQKDVITLDKTAEELYAAVKRNAPIKTLSTITAQDESVVVFEGAPKFSATKITSGETVIYEFCMISSDGVSFVAEDLAGTDAVVLTEV